MSIDELSYAGGEAGTALDAPYAWYYLNSVGGSITGSTYWWALSPSYWNGSDSVVWYVDGSGDPGYLINDFVDNSFAVRPQVSLSSCNLISRGDGSANNPYVVYIGSGSC